MLTRLFLQLAYVGAEWVLWLLIALSLVSVACIVERVLYFRRRHVGRDVVAGELLALLSHRNFVAAWDFSRQHAAVECSVVAAGLAVMGNGSQACSEVMLGAKALARRRLENYLAILATIGSNAPFVGLLGTVLGIIKAAHEMSVTDTAAASAVMAGVFEALVATAVGLFVAIPAVVAFNLFQRQVRATMTNVDAVAHQLLAQIPAEIAAAPPPPPGNPS